MTSFSKFHEKKRKSREEARKNTLLVKQRLLKEGRPVFVKYGIQKAVLFGSLADRRFQKSSDVDIFVAYLPNEKFYDFKRELENAVALPIDLYTDKDDPVFVKKILTRGEVIYEI
jgi:predicted nucleotidyltransferase